MIMPIIIEVSFAQDSLSGNNAVNPILKQKNQWLCQ